MAISSFTIGVHGNILSVGFKSVENGNSLGLEEAREITRLLREYGPSKGFKGLVFHSDHPRIFCSGGRLNDYASQRQRLAGLKVNREITRHLENLKKWPGIKLALVNGDCFGGGMELLSSFDFCWATPDVLMGFWQRRIGLTTGWGGGQRMATKIGEQTVRRLLISGEQISAPQALRLGLIEKIVLKENIVAEGIQWLRAGINISPVIPTDWTASNEAKYFSKLWWNPFHRQVLERWKR